MGAPGAATLCQTVVAAWSWAAGGQCRLGVQRLMTGAPGIWLPRFILAPATTPLARLPGNYFGPAPFAVPHRVPGTRPAVPLCPGVSRPRLLCHVHMPNGRKTGSPDRVALSRQTGGEEIQTSVVTWRRVTWPVPLGPLWWGRGCCSFPVDCCVWIWSLLKVPGLRK